MMNRANFLVAGQMLLFALLVVVWLVFPLQSRMVPVIIGMGLILAGLAVALLSVISLDNPMKAA